MSGIQPQVTTVYPRPFHQRRSLPRSLRAVCLVSNPAPSGLLCALRGTGRDKRVDAWKKGGITDLDYAVGCQLGYDPLGGSEMVSKE